MPISAPSLGGGEDARDPRFQSNELYDVEVMEFAGLTLPVAEKLLKQLGAGVSEKHELVEGMGWMARMEEVDGGVAVHFRAHDELLDDLLRRYEQLVEREVG